MTTTVRASAQIRVRTGADRVRSVLLDYPSWPQTFPAVLGVELEHQEGDRWDIRVSHLEGDVPNRLALGPGGTVTLSERKRHYEAEFVNHFRQVSPALTVYRVDGEIRLHGWRRALRPLAGIVARRRIHRLTLQPVKSAAEHLPPNPTRPRPGPGARQHGAP